MMFVVLGERGWLGGMWKGTGSAAATGSTAVLPVSGSYCGEAGGIADPPVSGSYWGEGGRGTREIAFACWGLAFSSGSSCARIWYAQFRESTLSGLEAHSSLKVGEGGDGGGKTLKMSPGEKAAAAAWSPRRWWIVFVLMRGGGEVAGGERTRSGRGTGKLMGLMIPWLMTGPVGAGLQHMQCVKQIPARRGQSSSCSHIAGLTAFAVSMW